MKKIYSLLLWLLVVLSGNANDTVTLTVSDHNLNVGLENDEAFCAFQMDVTIPAGMTVAMVTPTERIAPSSLFVVDSEMVEDNVLRIIAYNTDNQAMPDNAGELLQIALSTTPTVTDVIEVKNIRFVKASDFSEILLANITTASENPGQTDTDISEYDNILYLDKTEIRLGQQAILSFKMKNTAAIQTIGVYLELPEGMTVAEDDGDLLINLSTARTKTSRHSVSSNFIDGQYRIGILGTAGRAFEGTDGEVFTVTVDIDEKMAEGDYPIVLRNINLTDTNDVPYNTEYYKTTISVVDITPGDANGDGSVNMTDANIVTNYFLGKTNAVMKAKAADVNNDGSINMTDANMIVNMYLNQ